MPTLRRRLDVAWDAELMGFLHRLSTVVTSIIKNHHKLAKVAMMKVRVLLDVVFLIRRPVACAL